AGARSGRGEGERQRRSGGAGARHRIERCPDPHHASARDEGARRETRSGDALPRRRKRCRAGGRAGDWALGFGLSALGFTLSPLGFRMIKPVGVVGAGTMGNGIAQVFAQSGFSVLLADVAPAALDRARGTIEKSLARFVEKGKLAAADRDAALGRLNTTA